MENSKNFWTSTKFAELMIYLVVFLVGVTCGQVVESSRASIKQRRLYDALLTKREVSFVSVREFDFAKGRLSGKVQDDSVLVINNKVFMPDTLMTRLPEIPTE